MTSMNRIYRYGADTLADLLRSVELDRGLEVADSGHRFQYRLNFVAADKAQCTVKRKLIAHTLNQGQGVWNLQSQGVFLAERGHYRDAKLAAVFPGQGSHYVGMCRDLISQSSASSKVLNRINEGLKGIGLEPLRELIEDKSGNLQRDLKTSQAAILGCEMLGVEAIQHAGWSPDIQLGHSFGEYGALYAAGCWDEALVLRASAARVRAIQRSSGTRSRLLAAFCTAEIAREVCSEFPGEAYVANWNSWQQTVIGAVDSQYQSVLAAFEKRQIRTRELSVFHAFHTPLMQSAVDACRQEYEGLELNAPRSPFFSSVSERSEHDPGRLRENLFAQFVTPVRWPIVVRELYSRGARCFLEIGPGQTLTGLNRNTFQASDDVICVALDDPKLGCRQQAFVVQAAQEIWSHGLAEGPVMSTVAIEDSSGFGESWLARLRAKAAETGRDQCELAEADAAASERALWPTDHWVVTACDEAGNLIRQLRYRARSIDRNQASLPKIVHLSGRSPLQLLEWPWEIGGLAGRNEAGLCVSAIQVAGDKNAANHRVGDRSLNSPSESTQSHSPSSRPQPQLLSVTMSMVVTDLLATSRTVDEAAQRLAQAPVSGRWSVLLVDSTSISGLHVDLQAEQLQRQTFRDCWFPSAITARLPSAELPLGVRQHETDQQGNDQVMATFTATSIKLEATSGTASDVGPTSAASSSAGLSNASLPDDSTLSTTARQAASDSLVVSTDLLLRAGNSVDGKPPLGDRELVCTRLVPKLLAKPLSASLSELTRSGSSTDMGMPDHEVCRLATGTTLIIGGDHAHAAAISAAIQPRGGSVVHIPEWTDAQDLLQQIQQRPARHLIMLVGCHASVDEPEQRLNATRFEQQVMAPYLALQAWYVSLGDPGPDRPLVPATFVVATRWGGDLGWQSAAPLHVAGAWTGLAKAMFLERAIANSPDQRVGATDLRTQVIDFDQQTTAAFVAEAIVAETNSTVREAEIAYRNGVRHVVRSIQQPLELPPERPGQLDHLPRRGGAWIVTGGARGVTAEIVREMLHQLDVDIHLVGSSPLPQIDQAWLDYSSDQLRTLRTEVVRQAVERKVLPADEWARVEKAIEIARNLRRFEQTGGRVHYHVCDISSRDAVAELLARVRRLGKPIHGIVHGAGFEKASRFAGKKEALVRQTFRVKAIGAWNLMEATRSDPLDTFIGFASISGRYGSIGQTDYSAANEWLAKLISHYRTLRPSVHAVAMDWHSWDEVGMAARPESKQALTRKTVTYMPVAEGVRHFLAELYARRGDSEVVITDWNYHKKYFPDVVPDNPTASGAVPTVSSVQAVSRLMVEQWQGAPLQGVCGELGPIVIVGDNRLADRVAELGRAETAAVYRAATPRTPADLQRLQSLIQSVGCRQLVWLAARDEVARLGAGWRRHQERIEMGFNQGQEVLRSWLRDEVGSDSLCQVSSTDGDLNELVVADDRFAPRTLLFASCQGTMAMSGQITYERPIAPESFWPMHCCELAAEELSQQKTNRGASRLLAVQLDETLTDERAARGILAELSVSGGSARVFHSPNRRLVPVFGTLASANDAAPSGLSQPQQAADEGRPTSNGETWLVIGIDAQAGQRELAAMAETKRLSLRFLEADGLHQITTCVPRLSTERAAARDRITGLIIVETAESLSKAGGAESLQRLAALLESTRPDQLRSFMVLAPRCSTWQHAATLGGMRGWLEWYRRSHPETAVLLLEDAVTDDLALQSGIGKELDRWLAMPESHAIAARLATACVAATTSSAASPALARSPAPATEMTSPNCRSCQSAQASSSAPAPAPLPLAPLTQRLPTGEFSSRMMLDPVNDPFLADHRFRQRPLLPLVGMIELFLESAADAGLIARDLPFTTMGLQVIHGLKFTSDEPKAVDVFWRKLAEGYEGTLTTEFRDSRGRLMDARRPIAKVTLGGTAASVRMVERMDAPGQSPWQRFVYPPPDSIIYHGESFRWIEAVQSRGEQMLARVRGRSPREIGGERQGEWLIPLVLADVGLYVSGSLWFSQNPTYVTIPQGLDRWTLFQPVVPGMQYETLVVYRERQATQVSFDGVIVDDQKRPVMAFEGYRAALVPIGKEQVTR